MSFHKIFTHQSNPFKNIILQIISVSCASAHFMAVALMAAECGENFVKDRVSSTIFMNFNEHIRKIFKFRNRKHQKI